MKTYKINITQDEFDVWLTDLRSGTFKQGDSYLKRKRDDGICYYCCLGVLGERNGAWETATSIAGAFYLGGSLTFLDNNLIEGRLQEILAEMNDEGGLDFNEIAEWIEERCEATG